MASIVKFVAACAALFLGYQAAKYHYLSELVQHMSHCYPEAGVCEAVQRPLTEKALEGPMNTALACLKSRQSAIGALFHPVPATEPANSLKSAVPEEQRLKLASMCRDFATR